ncbi:MAG: BrnT family toxin [Acidobacteria bacterium]|nr:BrnT family toxin [Acidobacteriota bacterium]
MTFEWDARKAAANFTKHATAFEDAAMVFLDPLATTFPDPDHSKKERPEITIGCTMKGHLVFVSHCALRATRTEREQYERNQRLS